ncbi:FAD-binding protein [Haloechinothrix sp. LS1_15]|uniref:FAD-binding protein n=1 Tax=Haloechinothrix sp. LS1_15 TaxID=2652248 RepID=UPI0029470925|nr:FAD-binding protein [Haloechinothrix sp. LS1_15]MDV6013258.1 FAD-binding protein [Haloechinothrix sp. LS1_15]
MPTPADGSQRPARPRGERQGGATARYLDSLAVPHGTVLTSGSTRSAVAGDFGGVVYREPDAVLRPESADDIAAALRWACRHEVPVAARGAGHSANGQGQLGDGLVVDTRSLDAVEMLDTEHVSVDAGAYWSAVAEATLPHGRTPAVFTDYLETTVGGTLSVGGIGGASHRCGAQTDGVAELDVITGEGQVVRCSPERDPDLFDAARAGLGQYGIIARATVRLVEAWSEVRRYRLPYDDLPTFTADQRRLALERRFDYLEGFAEVTEDRRIAYVLEVATFVPAAGKVDDAAMVGDLRYERGGEEVEDLSYRDFLGRLEPGVAARQEVGEWRWPHPWLNVFLPDSATDAVVGGVLADLELSDMDNFGVVLIYPVDTTTVATPLLRMPGERLAFLFGLLLSASPDEPGSVERLSEQNRRFAERARSAGGYVYPIGPPSLSPQEWQQHYGSRWRDVVLARNRYDPSRILTPGPGLVVPRRP